MPNSSAKVAAMASIFQQQATEEKEKDTGAETVKKGRQSLPLFEEAGFVKHKKAALKRTNSQRDRFSNARMMFEKKGSSGDNLLDTSRSSITSVISNTSSITHNTNKASTRQAMSVSSTSGEEEDQETNPADKNNDPMMTVDKQAKVKISESNLPNKENISHSTPPPTTTLTSQSQVLSPNRQMTAGGLSKSDTKDFPEVNSKTPMDNSPPPPPLPSLPPPPLLLEDKPSLLGEDDIILLNSLEQPATSCQPDLLDIAKKLSFGQNMAPPSGFVTGVDSDTGTDTPLSDSRAALLEYAELCGSLPSLECREMMEEFDRLAGQIEDKADDDRNSEVENEKVQGINESRKQNPQVLESIKMSIYEESILPAKSNIKVEKSPNFTRSSSTHDDTRSSSTHDDTRSSSTHDDTKSLVNDDNEITIVTTFPSTPTESVTRTEEQKELTMKPVTLDENQNKSMNNKSQTASEDGNTSSLGSSLVCQSVSSWLGTPGSVSVMSINTDPSHKTGGDDDDDSKHVASTEESSDYVSGDSCELGSSSSSTVESRPFLGLQNGVEGKIHYLNDGNFWVEGPPLVPTSQVEDTPGTSELYHSPSMVKFSTLPVRIFSTYTEEEYDRSNDDIDPAAASAEYELEKRVEKMELFEVSLTKGEDGLGLSILGMGVGMDTGVEKLGIFIKTITAGGVAAKDGRIQVNDQIISVDGSCLVGVTQAFAASVLRNTAGLVQFVVGRDEEPGESEVAQLIRQSVQADRAGEEEQSGVEDDSSDDVSLAMSSSMEGELSLSCKLGKRADTCGEDEGCSVTTLPGCEQALAEVRVEQANDSTDNVDHIGEVDVSKENIGQDITAEQESLDSSASPDEDFADTSSKKVLNSVEKFSAKVTEEAEEKCCSHREKYKKLLYKYEQVQETMGQMERNMSIVTEQLLSREQLFSSHMSRLREVFSQLEEELHGTDIVAASQQSLQAVWSAMQLRGVLRRKPFIPTHPPPSADIPSLDLFIPPTPVLDTSLAWDKVSLVHRATLPRRRGRQGTKTASTSSTGLRLSTVEAEKVIGGSEFLYELRKTLMKNARKTAISECQGVSVRSTPPLSPNRASSLPSSPTISQYSSSSSLHSVPGNLDGLTEFKREKKRLSGKSLWQKARRRLSSR